MISADVVHSFHETLKGPCHAFPVLTRPLVCYEGFYACKRCAESQTLKVHPVASKTLTQKIPPQNASLEIRHCPFESSMSFRVRHVVKPYPERNGPIRGAVTLRPRSRYVKLPLIGPN